MTSSEILMVVFTAVIATTGVIGAIIFGKQLMAMQGQLTEMQRTYAPLKTSADAARQSADIAESALIAANRPWISISIARPASDLTWEAKGARLDVSVLVQNVGKHPAFDLAIEAHQYVIGPQHNEFATEINKFCGEVRSRQEARSDKGDILFPGETRDRTFGLLFDRADIESGAKAMGIPFFTPVVLICADYRSEVTGKMHKTGISYLLLTAGDPPGGLPKAVPTDKGNVLIQTMGLDRPPLGTVAD